MEKLNQKETVVNNSAKTAATVKDDEIRERVKDKMKSMSPQERIEVINRALGEGAFEKKLELLRKIDEEEKVVDPRDKVRDIETSKESAKQKENHLANNKKKNEEKLIKKKAETYEGKSAKHLLKHVHYAAKKDEVVIIGTTDKPAVVWKPDREGDVEASPVMCTYNKRMIMEKFVDMFRTVPEHFTIDHLNVQNIFDGVVVDSTMTVALIIDDLFWNSFTERVPKEMRGFHLTADDNGIRVISNVGHHTLEILCRLSISFETEKKLEGMTKKQIKAELDSVAKSLFIRFKMDNQELIRSNVRDPTVESFPIRIQDELIVPARKIGDGEEITPEGVILTPLVPNCERPQKVYKRNLYKKPNLKSFVSKISPVKMVGNAAKPKQHPDHYDRNMFELLQMSDDEDVPDLVDSDDEVPELLDDYEGYDSAFVHDSDCYAPSVRSDPSYEDDEYMTDFWRGERHKAIRIIEYMCEGYGKAMDIMPDNPWDILEFNDRYYDVDRETHTYHYHNVMLLSLRFVRTGLSGGEYLRKQNVRFIPNMLKSVSGIILGDTVDRMETVTDNITTAMKQGVELKTSPSLDATINNLTTKMQEITSKLDTVTMNVKHDVNFSVKGMFEGMFGSVFDKLKGILPESGEARDILVVIIIAMIYVWGKKASVTYPGVKKYVYVSLGIATVISKWSENEAVTTFCATLFGLSAASDLIPVILDWFCGDVEDEEETEDVIELESNSVSSIFNLVTQSYAPSAFVYALVAATFGILLQIAPNPLDVIHEVSILGRILNGVELSYSVVADAVINIINMLGSPFGVKIFRSCYTKFPEAFTINDQLNVMWDRFLEGRRMLKEDYVKFTRLKTALDELDKRIPKNVSNRAYQTQIDFSKRRIALLEDKFKTANVISGGVHAAPFVVTFVGPSGIGKSVVVPLVISAMAPIIYSAQDLEKFREDQKNFVCHVNPSDEFQETIHPGHNVIVVDDIFQMKNNNEDPKICHGNWLIHVNNNAEAVVNKAFGDKGMMTYNDVTDMFLSTNCEKLGDVKLSVIDVNAVGRRMGICLNVIIKEQYRLYIDKAKGLYMLDQSKCDGLTTDCWVFQVTSFVYDKNNMVTMPVEKKVMEFNDLIRYLMYMRGEHFLHQEMVLAGIRGASMNPKLTPFPDMNGMEIMNELAHTYKTSSKKIVPNYDLGKSLENSLLVKLPNSITEQFDRSYCKPWLKLIGNKDEVFIQRFFSFMDPVLLGSLQHHIPSLMDKTDKEILKAASSWNIDYKGLEAEEVVKLATLPKTTIKESISVAKRKFMTLFEGIDDVVPLYDSNPEFWNHFLENKEKYSAWINGSNMPFQMDANAKILGHRLMRPTENLDVLFYMLRQTFVAVSSIVRRFGYSAASIVAAMYNSTTWSEFVTAPFEKFKQHLNMMKIDMKAFGSDIYSSIAFALPYSKSSIAALAATVTFGVGAILALDPEMIVNSVMKVRFHPKASKDKKVNRTKVNIKPVVNASHVNGPSVDAKMGGNSRIWNEQVEVIANAALENLYSVYWRETLVSQAMFLKGHTMMVNAHMESDLFKKAVSGEKMVLADRRANVHDVAYHMCKTTVFDDKLDLSLITIPASKFNPRPDIVKFHIKEDQLHEALKLPNLECVLLYSKKTDDGSREMHHIGVTVNTQLIKYDKLSGVAMLVYSVEGHESACMSPIIVCDTRLKDVVAIIGYHSAGNAKGYTSTGAAVAVTQELLKEMITLSDVPPVKPVRDAVKLIKNANVPDRITVIDYVEPVAMSERSKLKKTPFHGFFGDLPKYPAITVPYTLIEDGVESEVKFPMFNSLDKTCNPTPAINDTIADFSRVMYTYKWDASIVKPELPYVGSFEDAINGRGCTGPDSRTTSVGYDFRIRGITKERMYGKEGPRDLTTPLMLELKREFEDNMSKLRRGEMIHHDYLCFLKSELVKETKIVIGKMRMVCGIGSMLHWLKKALFGYGLSLASENNIRNGLLIGTNPYSEDWNVMGKLLAAYMYKFDGDWEGFDTNFFYWVCCQFKKFNRHVYYNAPEEDHVARETLIDDMNSPFVVIMVRDGDGALIGIRIQLRDILASGDTLTQWLGSFGGEIFHRYCFLMEWCKSVGTTHLEYDVSIHPKPKLEDEEANIMVFQLGDDNIFAMKEERYGYNAIQCQKNMKEINTIYTPPDKTKEYTVPWRNFEELSIVKRLFAWSSERKRYLAPIETSSILGALYWDENDMKFFGQIVDTMLQEAALKGRDFHLEFSNALRKRAYEVKYNLISVYLDYDIAINFVLNTAYLPWGVRTLELALTDESGVDTA